MLSRLTAPVTSAPLGVSRNIHFPIVGRMMAPFPSGLRGHWSRWLCLSVFLKYLKSEQQYISFPPKDKKSSERT